MGCDVSVVVLFSSMAARGLAGWASFTRACRWFVYGLKRVHTCQHPAFPCMLRWQQCRMHSVPLCAWRTLNHSLTPVEQLDEQVQGAWDSLHVSGSVITKCGKWMA